MHRDVVRHELAADPRPERRRRRHVNLWWQLATIISCGTLARRVIPEFTKVFTSSHSKHVHEIVTASREGGASLTILSGLVGRQLQRLLDGHLIAGLMAVAYFVSIAGRSTLMSALTGAAVGVGSIFAFGLVAFGFLCMGPVNIAVDSYGPVTDNAQSVFELAQTETHPRHQGGDQARLRLRRRTSSAASTTSRRTTRPATPSRRPPSRC